MEEKWKDLPQSLRERPPAWPADDSEVGADDRGLRAIDRFEEPGSHETYPGAAVMDDLMEGTDEVAAVRILARFTVVRLFLLSGAGWLAGSELRLERRVALQHLELLPEHDWERITLERLADLCRETPASTIVAVAVAAAEAAAKREHVMGAFALYRAAFEMARGRAWWGAAATAAHGVGRLARLNEAYYSARLWERRARVLDRRVAREADVAEAAVRGRSDGGK